MANRMAKKLTTTYEITGGEAGAGTVLPSADPATQHPLTTSDRPRRLNYLDTSVRTTDFYP